MVLTPFFSFAAYALTFFMLPLTVQVALVQTFQELLNFLHGAHSFLFICGLRPDFFHAALNGAGSSRTDLPGTSRSSSWCLLLSFFTGALDIDFIQEMLHNISCSDPVSPALCQLLLSGADSSRTGLPGTFQSSSLFFPPFCFCPFPWDDCIVTRFFAFVKYLIYWVYHIFSIW